MKEEKKPLESFDYLKHGDVIISPIDKEVTAFLIDSEGEKYLSNKSCIYPLHQFLAEDFYIYDGKEEVGEIDEEFFNFLRPQDESEDLNMKDNILLDSGAFINLCKEKIADYFNGLETTEGTKLEKDYVYLVWYAKELQNHKALLSTPVADGRYYEVTYNGDKNEIYFDAYVKEKNICFKLDSED